MNETLSVERFTAGLISNPDMQDISNDAYVAGSNIDPDGDGKLIGIPASSSKSTNVDAKAFQQGCFIRRSSGEYDLIYHEGHDICAMADFYDATPDYSVVKASVTGTSFVPHNQEVYIASTTPRWVGRTDYEQFGVDTYEGGLHIENAEIPRPASAAGEIYISDVTGHAGTSAFSLGSTYTYTLSIVYDGLQESPLSSTEVTFIPDYTDYDYATVTIKCNAGYSNLAGVNRRITAVKLYRKETKYSVELQGTYKIGDTVTSVGNYQLLQVINVADDAGVGFGSTSWTIATNDYQILYVDYNIDQKGTYETESGMPESLTSTHVNYALNTYGNGFMFVGNCSVTGLPDASHMIFRSSEFRFSMYNWIENYVLLESIPTALHFFNSRLFAFDDNRVYLINPENLEVEDRYEGGGCTAQKSVIVTPHGLFWANRYNCYHFDGTQTHILTDRIRTDWQASATSITPVVLYDTKKNVVIFNTQDDAYLWHLGKKRWDYCKDFVNGDFSGGFTGRYGETYAADGSSLVENFGGATTRGWDYYSKEFTFDTPGQVKEFYHLIVDPTTSITITYSIDGGSNWRSLTSSTQIKDIGGAWEKKKSLRVKLIGAATTSVDSYEIVYRRMRGNRG